MLQHLAQHLRAASNEYDVVQQRRGQDVFETVVPEQTYVVWRASQVAP